MPLLTVVIVLFSATVVVFTFTPVAVVAFTAPLNVVVPEPAAWLRLAD